MERWAGVIIPILITSILFAPFYAHADTPIVVQPVINFDLHGLIESVAQNASAITGALGSIPSAVFGLFREYIEGAVKEIDNQLVSLLKALVSANPDPENMKEWADTAVAIVSAFYLLVFLAAGLAFMLAGISPEKRHRAKEWLKNAVIMVIAVNISFPVYSAALELAAAITNFIWGSVPDSFFLSSAFSGMNIAALALFAMSASFAILTLFLRYLFLLMGAALFPIGLFLYFIPPLRAWGMACLNLIGAAIAMQLVDALVFSAAANMLSAFAGTAPSGFVLAFTFMAIGLLNIAMMLYAMAKSAFAGHQPRAVPMQAEKTGTAHANDNSALTRALHRVAQNVNALSATLSTKLKES